MDTTTINNTQNLSSTTNRVNEQERMVSYLKRTVTLRDKRDTYENITSLIFLIGVVGMVSAIPISLLGTRFSAISSLSSFLGGLGAVVFSLSLGRMIVRDVEVDAKTQLANALSLAITLEQTDKEKVEKLKSEAIAYLQKTRLDDAINELVNPIISSQMKTSMPT